MPISCLIYFITIDILLEKEKHIVAYHEAGHAYLSCILNEVENPVKVSIIPREKGMLGFSKSEVSLENLVTKGKMEQYIQVLMAGRACEEIFCQDVTNGASNDMEKATQLANNYIKMFGFCQSNKFMAQKDDNPYKNQNSNFIMDKFDKEVIDFLNQKYQETLDLIKANKENVEIIKINLINKETLYYDDLVDVIKSDSIKL